MSEHEKELVSFDQFVSLLNEELKRSHVYQDGIFFTNIGSGFDITAPMLSDMDKNSLAKCTFDKVSSKFVISR